MAEADDTKQCRAIIEGGDRCSRPAQENGFCYQHGPDDETVDEQSDHTEDSQDTEDTDMGDESTGDGSIDAGEIGQVRRTIRDVTEDLIGRPLVSVIVVERDDDGWRAVVEVVERKSVPDTQDILGRYEIGLEDPDTITSYRRTHRYRRDDTEQNI